MNCQLCEQDPCSCKAKRTFIDWVIQHCTTPGCTVAIRVKAGQQEAVPVCKWCLAGTSYYRGERWKDWKKA